MSSLPHSVRAVISPGSIFWSPNGGSGISVILDLLALNRYLRKYKFRMLTHASLLRLV